MLDAVRRWSDDELRSLNAQIEYILRDALRKSGRLNPGSLPPDAAKQDAAKPETTEDGDDR